jgi:hypothetical protein
MVLSEARAAAVQTGLPAVGSVNSRPVGVGQRRARAAGERREEEAQLLDAGDGRCITVDEVLGEGRHALGFLRFACELVLERLRGLRDGRAGGQFRG